MFKRQNMVPHWGIAPREKKRLNGSRLLGAGKFVSGTNQNHLPLSEGCGDALVLREESKDISGGLYYKAMFKFGRKNCQYCKPFFDVHLFLSLLQTG